MIFSSSSHEKFPLENQILFLCAKKQGGVNSVIVFLSLRGNVSVVTSCAKMSRHLFEGLITSSHNHLSKCLKYRCLTICLSVYLFICLCLSALPKLFLRFFRTFISSYFFLVFFIMVRIFFRYACNILLVPYLPQYQHDRSVSQMDPGFLVDCYQLVDFCVD